MAKLDELKEILNTLRVSLSLVVGLIVILTGSLVSKEQSGNIDIYFWLGIAIELVLLGIFVKIILKIKKHTREIKDL
jgi:hypothetical protein